jgi:hypothetical protein
MTRFVIGPDVARPLAREKVVVQDGHELLAPTRLQADARVTLDARLAAEAEAEVAVAPYASLIGDTGRDPPCTD